MRELLIEIAVKGTPQPQGSASAYVPLHPQTKQPFRKGGRIVVNVTHSNADKLKVWRKHLADALREQWGMREKVEAVGVEVEVIALLARPQGHYGTGRNAHVLKDSAPAFPITRPDTDKLMRAFGDALSEVVLADDALITDWMGRKRYGVPTEDNPTGEGAVLRCWRNEVQLAEDLPDLQRVRWVPPAENDFDAAGTLFETVA